MSTLGGIIRYYVAVAWSMVKVVAVTGIIGVGLILGVYFSPLELSGPKIAIAALVFGLMGAAHWYARYFPALREQLRGVGITSR